MQYIAIVASMLTPAASSMDLAGGGVCDVEGKVAVTNKPAMKASKSKPKVKVLSLMMGKER